MIFNDHSFQIFKGVGIDAFQRDISESAITDPSNEDDVEQPCLKYNSVLAELFDKYSPQK